jgi:hypothetical protein
MTHCRQLTELWLFLYWNDVQSSAKGEHMVHSVSETWKHDHATARQLLDTVLAWVAVLAVAGVVFAGLYLGIASLE